MALIMLRLCLVLVFLATVILCSPDHEALLMKLNQMVLDNELIDKEFRPIKDGYINKGSFGVVFKGQRVADNKTVALKFTAASHKNETDREYEMYTYLNGVDNENIEEFGFCNIYYYGDFKLNSQVIYKLMIFTYLSGSLARPAEKGYFNSRANTKYGLNTLILFRDFLNQAKYMHMHGVRHDDIKPDNILLKGHRSYLIDFNLSSRLKKKFGGGTLLYASRNFHRNQMRHAMDDMESFFYSMSHINLVPLKWFFNTPFLRLSPGHVLNKFRTLKEDTNDTIIKIEKAITKCDPLKIVFFAFAQEIFFNKHSGGVPNYQHLERVVNEQIAKMVPNNHPVVFTWLESDLTHEAISDLMKSPMRNIKELNPINSFGWIKYPRVDYKYFQNKRHGSITLSQRIISTFMNLMTVCDKGNFDKDMRDKEPLDYDIDTRDHGKPPRGKNALALGKDKRDNREDTRNNPLNFDSSMPN